MDWFISLNFDWDWILDTENEFYQNHSGPFLPKYPISRTPVFHLGYGTLWYNVKDHSLFLFLKCLQRTIRRTFTETDTKVIICTSGKCLFFWPRIPHQFTFLQYIWHLISLISIHLYSTCSNTCFCPLFLLLNYKIVPVVGLCYPNSNKSYSNT